MKYLLLALVLFVNFAFAQCLPEPPPVSQPQPPIPGTRYAPAPGTTWQWQLQGKVDTSVDAQMFNVDLFDTPVSTIATLHKQGKKVICYFSAGSSEDWRPDADSFPASVKGKSNGWNGEKWLDIRQISVLQPIMEKRMDLAVSKGCDGVEPDNVDGYSNSTKFKITGNQQLVYNQMLATIAHKRNLAVGLKNDVDQIASLVSYFDFAVNEQCYQYKECDGYSAFINQNKAVFGVEYKGATSNFCPKANAARFSWLKKNLDLDAYRVAC